MTAVSTRSKISIIGAGSVGISAARALMQKGIAYDQFEADGAIGGNWRHGVYTTAHIISSRFCGQHHIQFTRLTSSGSSSLVHFSQIVGRM